MLVVLVLVRVALVELEQVVQPYRPSVDVVPGPEVGLVVTEEVDDVE